jgi:ABC-type transport system involved in multi-copper enzyme maturation permease subunit
MLNMKSVWSIAQAETRITRRLVRYWVFLVFSYLIMFIAFIYYSILHGLFSTYSATAGLVCPKFLVSLLGIYYLVIYSVCVVFLAFDIRSRDRRERMIEVLDSRPYTNLELVAGRFLGILIPSWVPIPILVVLLELLGMLLKGVGSPIGEPVELYSLLAFVFFMSLPCLAFVLSIVFLVTLLVRNRLVSAVILLILMGLNVWAMAKLPVYQAQIFDIYGSFEMGFPSDLILPLTDAKDLLQRIAILIASLGILGISAAVHPRLDDGSRAKLAVKGTAIVIIAACLIGFVYFNNVKVIRNQELWYEAHGKYGQEPVPDLKTVSGKVKIIPGKRLDLDLDITFCAPEDNSLKKALFTLNPGQKVTKILDIKGKPVDFIHNNGLLEISLPEILSPGEETVVRLHAEGLPDKNFAYLKSAMNILEMSALNSSNIALLGGENIIFNSGFVALMPASRWLPASGPEKGRDDPRERAADFYNVDLLVEVPEKWLVAGPGRRQNAEEKDGITVFRFSPPSQVPEVALIASQFESRSFEVDNVLMELLISKKHMKNIEVLADTADKIREWAGDRLKEAQDMGLGYPYDGFTVVEVPTRLRAYGGGWRLDTVQFPPGLLLLRELSLPTARFDSAFRDPKKFKDKEGGIAQAKWERLQTFFKNDFSGGNILTGAPRNFFLYQTSAKGPESLALNFVMETLSGLLVADTKGYFSAHIYAGTKLNSIITSVILNYVQTSSLGVSVSDATIRTMTSRPVVWEKALEVPLKDMDPWKNPADTVDVLTLKGYAISQTIMDVLGREKTAALLSNIRNNHRCKSFSYDDMKKAGIDLGYDFNELFGDWIGSTGLPGFVVSEARGYRIPDDANGSPQYQLLFTVRNDESVPGVFRFVYLYPGESNNLELATSESIRLEGKHALQYGTIMSRLPNNYFLEPYLSLNRMIFLMNINSIETDKIVNKEPVKGIEEIPWILPVDDSIVVDDLDKGFETTEEKEEKGLRLKARDKKGKETDQGLPYIATNIAAFPPPGEWSRITETTAWGNYRHTYAVIKPGNGSKRAVFSTSLPNDGAWDLELHMPMKNGFLNRRYGLWHIIVNDSNGDQHKIEFDSQSGIQGWNMAEKLNLPEGKVTVELSDRTNGQLVVADAIRWTPSKGN